MSVFEKNEISWPMLPNMMFRVPVVAASDLIPAKVWATAVVWESVIVIPKMAGVSRCSRSYLQIIAFLTVLIVLAEKVMISSVPALKFKRW